MIWICGLSRRGFAWDFLWIPRCPRSDSLFCFAFGGSVDTIDTFASMFAAAKKAAGNDVKLYAHQLTEDQGQVVPTGRQSLSIVLILNDAADSQWTPTKLGDFFTNLHVADPNVATLRPAWRVQLSAGPCCAHVCVSFCLRDECARICLDPIASHYHDWFVLTHRCLSQQLR